MVVFESDDWGLLCRDCSDTVRRFGDPLDWSGEALETLADLDALFDLLGRHRDADGRPACFTANAIVANPDYDAIEADGFARYHDVPLAVSHPALAAKHREGAGRKVWLLQYHGRAHLSTDAWLADLRSGEPRATYLFDARCHGGLSLLAAEVYRYTSEYGCVDPSTGRRLEPDPSFVAGGIREFSRLAGADSRSTIAPHYAFPDWIEHVWRRNGIRLVQGCNRRVVPGAGGAWVGAPSPPRWTSAAGCLHLTRTVRFDPRPQAEPRFHWPAALGAALACIRRGDPVVVDTHRINYVGRWRDDALHELDTFLRHLTDRAEVRFMTTPQLGDVLARDGG